MKTRKILAVFCCMMLMVSLTGCFPFNLLQNLSQSGGSDGPTSLIPPESSEDYSEDYSEPESQFNFNFEDFSEIETTEETSTNPFEEYDTLAAWFGYEDEDAMWIFYDTYAVLYEDATNYYIASYAYYYDDDAIEYIANDLSEFGLTESEQRESIGELYEGERYYCIVFEDIEVYEDDTYVGYYDEDMLAFVGFEYKEDDNIIYDLLNMSTQEMLSFYTYEDYNFTDTSSVSEDAGTVSEDTQRIGSVETGYTDVPADYYPFTDPTVTGDIIQYCDSTGTNIVTLTYYEDTDLTAKACAGAMLQNFEQDPEIDPDSITAAVVTLDDCDAYQVYGYYPAEDLFLIIWFLDSPEDDYIHYISVEITSDNYALFEMVENTYHVAY